VLPALSPPPPPPSPGPGPIDHHTPAAGKPAAVSAPPRAAGCGTAWPFVALFVAVERGGVAEEEEEAAPIMLLVVAFQFFPEIKIDEDKDCTYNTYAATTVLYCIYTVK
jgi:hypothetical protein